MSTMKEQISSMQSQFQTLISALGKAHMNENEKNSMARNLYDSGLLKGKVTTPTKVVEEGGAAKAEDPGLI